MADAAPALEVLASTPDTLARLAATHDPGTLRSRPFEGKWTPNEILGHFSDAEWAFGWRTRVVLGDDAGELARFDQDGWVAVQRLNDRDPAELVEMFRQLRGWNLVVWRGLTGADLERTGFSRKLGRPITMRELLETFARHDRHHLDQVSRYLAAVR